MKFLNRIRQLQDDIRNRGWRIHWIPWQEEGKPEYIYNTPFSLFTSFLGVSMFLGAIAYILYNRIDYDNAPKETIILITTAILGLFVAILGRIYADYKMRKDWIELVARCVDREIAKTKDSDGDTVWVYRLLCEFDFQGKKYKVTPEIPNIFNSEKKVREYLDKNISADGFCRLFIDPKNPFHAVFHKK